MHFEHPMQHTPESIARLETLLSRRDLPPSDMLHLAQELVAHGHRSAPTAIAALRAGSRHADVVAYCDRLERVWYHLRSVYRLEEQSAELLAHCYSHNGFIALRPPLPSRRLLVVFTTLFNNFAISTAALASLLTGTGANLLILKDSTIYNYHRGVYGLAEDFPSLSKAIHDHAARIGADRIYYSGFSSGGYAALLTSLLGQCDGYLGFSHITDLSANSSLPPSRHMPPQLRTSLDQRWFRDLRPMLAKADPTVHRRLIYGAKSAPDIVHAENLSGLNTVSLTRLADATHNTVQHLLESGSLSELFRQFVAD